MIAGKLFAVGGVDKKYVKLRSVESFDPSTGKWSPEPDMLTARYNCGVEEAAVRTLRSLAAMISTAKARENLRLGVLGRARCMSWGGAMRKTALFRLSNALMG
jgi:hypothetical protein